MLLVPAHADPLPVLNAHIVGLFAAAETLPSPLRLYKCKRFRNGLYIVTLSILHDGCRGEVRLPDVPYRQAYVEEEDPHQCARLLEVGCRNIDIAQVGLYQYREVSQERAAEALEAFNWLAHKLGKAN